MTTPDQDIQDSVYNDGTHNLNKPNLKLTWQHEISPLMLTATLVWTLIKRRTPPKQQERVNQSRRKLPRSAQLQVVTGLSLGLPPKNCFLLTVMTTRAQREQYILQTTMDYCRAPGLTYSDIIHPVII